MALKVLGTDGANHPTTHTRRHILDGMHLSTTEIKVVRMLNQGFKFQDACEFASFHGDSDALYDKITALGLN